MTASCSGFDNPATVRRTLKDLPNELLVNIAGYMYDPDDHTDLNNLRLAGSAKLAGAALEAFATRTRIICLEMSSASVLRFLDICRSPSHATYIEEVRYSATMRSSPSRNLLQQGGCTFVTRRRAPSEEVVQEVLREYEHQLLDRKQLLTEDVMFRTLAEGLPLLPKLKTITVCDHPRGVPNEGRLGKQSLPDGPVPSAYNRLRIWRAGAECWRNFHTTTDCMTSVWPAIDHLRYASRYCTNPGPYQGLQSMIRAVATVDTEGRTDGLTLNLWVTAELFDDSWGRFALANRDTIETALRNVSALHLDVGDRDRLGYRFHMRGAMAPQPRQWNNWLAFLDQASSIHTFSLAGDGHDFHPLLGSLLASSKLVFPHLQHLTIDVGLNRNLVRKEPPAPPGYPTYWYGVIHLIEFLGRHDTSLQHVNISHISGHGPCAGVGPRYKPLPGLHLLLGFMMDGPPNLKSAHVREEQWVKDVPEPDYADVPDDYSNSSVYAFARSQELASNIGVLARQCGIEAEGVEKFPYPLERRFVGENGSPLRLFMRRRSLNFEYDFGPYVLRNHEKRGNDGFQQYSNM